MLACSACMSLPQSSCGGAEEVVDGGAEAAAGAGAAGAGGGLSAASRIWQIPLTYRSSCCTAELPGQTTEYTRNLHHNILQ